jgi:hypothetical protein
MHSPLPLRQMEVLWEPSTGCREFSHFPARGELSAASLPPSSAAGNAPNCGAWPRTRLTHGPKRRATAAGGTNAWSRALVAMPSRFRRRRAAPNDRAWPRARFGHRHRAQSPNFPSSAGRGAPARDVPRARAATSGLNDPNE